MASHRRTYQHDAVSSAVDPNTTIDEERLSGAGEEDDNNFSSIAQLSKQLLEKANTDDEYKYRNNDTHHQDKDDADNASSYVLYQLLFLTLRSSDQNLCAIQENVLSGFASARSLHWPRDSVHVLFQRRTSTWGPHCFAYHHGNGE
eukprot:gb/GECG01003900.1/.p1 GENE.gb/GECG01003900.1/~~gb/GECG01003900.1/.p1  ORF type:complete len:146 (+),score=19.41 gb/GECG01003900.1/:1-438(+)